MILLDLLFAFLMALILAALLTGPAGWRHPRRPDGWGTGLFLFLLLLPVIWAGGVWLSPMGPPVGGSYWLPLVVVGVMVALLVLAIGSSGGPTTLRDNARAGAETGAGTEPDVNEAAALGITALFGFFFWLLLLAGVVGIAAFYMGH